MRPTWYGSRQDRQYDFSMRRSARFIEHLRAAINDAIGDVDPHSLCVEEQRAGIRRIADTLSEVDYVLLCNLANLDTALTRRPGCGLLPIIEVHLAAVGGGPTLDYVNARDFLTVFESLVDLAHRRRVN